MAKGNFNAYLSKQISMPGLITIIPAQNLTGQIIKREFSQFGKIVQIGFEGSNNWRVAYVSFQFDASARNAALNPNMVIDGKIYLIEYIEHSEFDAMSEKDLLPDSSPNGSKTHRSKLRKSSNTLSPTPFDDEQSSHYSRQDHHCRISSSQKEATTKPSSPIKAFKKHELPKPFSNSTPTTPKPKLANMAELTLPSFLKFADRTPPHIKSKVSIESQHGPSQKSYDSDYDISSDSSTYSYNSDSYTDSSSYTDS